ncbi:putative RNA polymerase II transcription elongation factor Elongin/SIII [Paratrimastix pyriformis]|uniref:Elongin-C n=1 Tax=Paratrimastix pyriformis TaxID=342808 RepID=A0ABQ8UKQ6_9EUKA|nr:putative RNA polymerase II transcription elongation factor Elongin/SIII [Paratrimastix pyriformis]
MQERVVPVSPWAEQGMIKLISSDGFEFIVGKKEALVSQTIRSMLQTGSFRETRDATITFPEINGELLEIAIQYFYYRTRSAQRKARGDSPPEQFNVPPQLGLQLLMVANYLNC